MVLYVSLTKDIFTINHQIFFTSASRFIFDGQIERNLVTNNSIFFKIKNLPYSLDVLYEKISRKFSITAKNNRPSKFFYLIKEDFSKQKFDMYQGFE